MINWQSSLWKRWITQFRHWAPSGCRHNGSAARRRRAAKQWLGLERLEDRRVPAFVSFSLAADEPQVDPQPPVAFDVVTQSKENSAVEIDVLANAFDPDGTLDSATLMIGSGPAHGTATVRQSSSDSPIVLYVPDTGFRGRDVFATRCETMTEQSPTQPSWW